MFRVRFAPVFFALVTASACGRTDATTAPTETLQPPPHYPIIFVHGYLGSSATWTAMIARFKADGWTDRELVNWSYDFNQSNVVIAGQIAAKVDSVLAVTGAHHVDIITHSMGSLSARYYVRNVLTGSDTSTKVDALVSLAGTNHGTTLAALCAPASCIEMRPGSAFLTNLNSVRETWGTPRYATWWSACDEAVIPQNSTVLAGATNTQTACLGHSDIYGDATVYQQVRQWVRPTRYGL
ncbi:MAG: alpha/beta hydrolase [Gemmatimonadaceae bacterium]|nr:alpha/beta hydrolase [Gemmatimonadaceae bacterium]